MPTLKDVRVPQTLASGIPSTYQYRQLLETGSFKAMEEFSNRFIGRNATSLAPYAQKWVKDPLHQWSRQWEYPYALSAIASHLKWEEGGKQSILDAGSGITFFPYFIKSIYGQSDVWCCDVDSDLAPIYSSINSTSPEQVQFASCSLDNLTFPDALFSSIYCISVLEHTDNYVDILREFSRVLKPGGLLVLTFDVSLDNTLEIIPKRADQLLHDLGKSFVSLSNIISVSDSAKNLNILTTRYAGKVNRHWLPWPRRPFLRRQIAAFFAGDPVPTYPPPLTVYCATFRKP